MMISAWVCVASNKTQTDSVFFLFDQAECGDLTMKDGIKTPGWFCLMDLLGKTMILNEGWSKNGIYLQRMAIYLAKTMVLTTGY